MGKLSSFLFAPVLVLLSFSLCALAQPVRFKVAADLGAGITASHLNDRDDVLTVYQGAPAVWSAANGFTKLVLPEPTAHYSSVYASGLNNVGQVIGGGREAVCTGCYPDPYDPGYIWVWKTPNTVPIDIVPSLGGSLYYYSPTPQAINNKGMVIGNSYPNPSIVPWILSSGSQESRPLPNAGGRATFVGDVNDAGTIVGYSTEDGNGQPHAFVSSTVSNRFLDALPGDHNSDAVAISNSGAIAGGSKLDGEHGYRAVIWVPGSAVADLGTPAGMFSNATAISDADWIIGTWGQGSTTRPFLWRPGAGMADLALLVDLSGTDLKSVSSALDINARGDILATVLDANGRSHTVLFSLVPEPRAAIFIAGGFLLLIGWRTRMRAPDGTHRLAELLSGVRKAGVP
jgi:probable HAF family extracellular repeat protein